LASAATFVATAACAQVASTAPESPPKGAQPVAVVQEVIVTAQKRSENLQEVPISVTAISNTQLESQHVYDPSQLGRVAPTLQMESFNASVGGTNFSVRGVGTLSFASSIEASVTTVIDGVVMGRPEFGIMNFSDIAQVEVLNGPQGMLFGKNASAGLVNITTVLPVLGLWQGSGHAEYGWMSTPGNGKGTADNVTLNAPVSANSALRINAFFTQHDPLVRDVLTVPGSDFGQQEFGFRAKYYWQPSDRLNVLVAADYAQEQGEGPGAT
jgi:iron complex outermembrane receptor protein